MLTTALFVHIPVDMFDIVTGPTAVICFDILDRLARGAEEVETRMKLRTDASKLEYWRKIKICSIFAVNGNEFQFTAIFAGRVVSGVYHMDTRTGWFNLD